MDRIKRKNNNGSWECKEIMKAGRRKGGKDNIIDWCYFTVDPWQSDLNLSFPINYFNLSQPHILIFFSNFHVQKLMDLQKWSDSDYLIENSGYWDCLSEFSNLKCLALCFLFT